MDLSLDVLNAVAGLNVQGNGAASQCADKDLHATTQAQDEVEGALLLDVVVRKSATVLELLSSKDEALLVSRDAFFVVDLSLDVLNAIAGLDVQGNGAASECADKNLHCLQGECHKMTSIWCV